MSTGTRRRFGLAAVLIAVLALSSYAYAHDSWRHMGDEVDRKGSERLTPEQEQKLDELHLKYDEQILALEKEILSKRGELEAYASRDDADPEEVSMMREEIRSLGRQIDDLEFEARLESWKVLGRDQLPSWTCDLDGCDGSCEGSMMHSRRDMGISGSDRAPHGSRGSAMERGCCR
jgi:Spy/CpxP family protein refolding chaperone